MTTSCVPRAALVDLMVMYLDVITLDGQREFEERVEVCRRVDTGLTDEALAALEGS